MSSWLIALTEVGAVNYYNTLQKVGITWTFLCFSWPCHSLKICVVSFLKSTNSSKVCLLHTLYVTLALHSIASIIIALFPKFRSEAGGVVLPVLIATNDLVDCYWRHPDYQQSCEIINVKNYRQLWLPFFLANGSVWTQFHYLDVGVGHCAIILRLVWNAMNLINDKANECAFNCTCKDLAMSTCFISDFVWRSLVGYFIDQSEKAVLSAPLGWWNGKECNWKHGVVCTWNVVSPMLWFQAVWAHPPSPHAAPWGIVPSSFVWFGMQWIW